ncbi:MAG: FtsX-like permease family protein [Clostridiales bacterium]|nr:FtsX-like permease family protein [Clostridiales bacterium]
MRPFSAMTYIRGNKWRVLVLVLMMSFITVCFIGGMYVDNPGESFRIVLGEPNTFLLLSPRGSSNDAIDQYHALQEELPDMLPDEAKTILYVNHGYFDYESIEMFNCTTNHYIFKSVEDFEIFKERTGLVPKEITLGNGETAMTELLANNRGFKVGDSITNSGSLTLAKTLDQPGMRVYSVLDLQGTGCMMILSNDGNCDQKLHEDLDRLAREISARYPRVYCLTNSFEMEDVEQQMGFMYDIFGAIVAVLTIVLLVTINAAFTAAYDKRKHEFAIYKAIGFTKGQIFRKVASEVLLMNAAAIALGALLNGGTILVLNQVLWSYGHHFYRVSKMALWGTVIAEVLIITTIIFLNWRKVRKCEVTEE